MWLHTLLLIGFGFALSQANAEVVVGEHGFAHPTLLYCQGEMVYYYPLATKIELEDEKAIFYIKELDGITCSLLNSEEMRFIETNALRVRRGRSSYRIIFEEYQNVHGQVWYRWKYRHEQ